MRNHSNSGAVQFTTILLFLGIGIAGYLFYALVPAFSDNYTVKQSLQGITNQAWRRMGQEEMHKQVMEKLATIGTHIETPAGGLPVEVRGLPIADEDVVVTCTDQSQDCSGSEGFVEIKVSYQRVMALPYLKGKSITLKFAPSSKDSLAPAAW